MALIACPECGKHISDQAVACPSCAYPLKLLGDAKPAASKNEQSLGFRFVFFTLLCVLLIGGFIGSLFYKRSRSSSEPASVSVPSQPSMPSSQQELSSGAPEPMTIRVTSQIVKKVAGKHRYFFDIRNEDRKAFDGAVTITLLNRQPGVINGKETFSTSRPLEPKLGTSVYMQINTGPPHVRGE